MIKQHHCAASDAAATDDCMLKSKATSTSALPPATPPTPTVGKGHHGQQLMPLTGWGLGLSRTSWQSLVYALYK